MELGWESRLEDEFGKVLTFKTFEKFIWKSTVLETSQNIALY